MSLRVCTGPYSARTGLFHARNVLGQVQLLGRLFHERGEVKIFVVHRLTCVTAAVDDGALVDGQQTHGNQSVAAPIDRAHERKTQIRDLTLEQLNRVAQIVARCFHGVLIPAVQTNLVHCELQRGVCQWQVIIIIAVPRTYLEHNAVANELLAACNLCVRAIRHAYERERERESSATYPTELVSGRLDGLVLVVETVLRDDDLAVGLRVK
jgi:hypothetical protein